MAMGGLINKALCRDCHHRFIAARRCPDCGSPRHIHHPEIDSLGIAHVDCDAFYAAVEKRDDPSLADKPLIIGGNSDRGVVSTACYIARTYGVHSAMPMVQARKLCPHAVILKPDMERYRIASRAVRNLMDALTPLVEPLSLDEAFLDLTGTEALHGLSPAEQLAHLASDVEKTIGISLSVGLSHNKFLAKIASDLKKPRGFSIIGKAETLDFLARQKVSLIWGVGKAMCDRLHNDGITHIGQLQQMEEADLLRRYGSFGGKLWRLARGIDDRQIVTGTAPKSVSAETTFEHDIADYETLEIHLWKQCERLSKALKKKDLAAGTVTLKLKTARHRQITRSRALFTPSQLADRLFEMGQALLKPECRDQIPYRLLGITGTNFTPAQMGDTPDFLQPEKDRRAKAERTMDQINARFGTQMVKKGRSV
ncbi:DNA polymerase IV [Iodidimonas gelatinilytica]|uniref:DNA polymerase IV n=1 Tax=Iodidimonas gelatinilytica TaxID=1236966 RepID=UPI0012313DE3|nr:DNA polymerase IV [Iodidimonas gelatinilytica]